MVYADQIKAHFTSPLEENRFYKPFLEIPDNIDSAEKERLVKAGQKAVTEYLIPAYRELFEYFSKIYYPSALELAGAWQWPDGKKWR